MKFASVYKHIGCFSPPGAHLLWSLWRNGWTPVSQTTWWGWGRRWFANCQQVVEQTQRQNPKGWKTQEECCWDQHWHWSESWQDREGGGGQAILLHGPKRWNRRGSAVLHDLLQVPQTAVLQDLLPVPQNAALHYLLLALKRLYYMTYCHSSKLM